MSQKETAKFSPTFNITLISSVMREVLIFRMNQMARENTAKHFWRAQSEVTQLRTKLETAYKSSIQKAKIAKQQTAITDLWCYGLVAYDLITEQGMKLSDVLNMSGAKLERMAAEMGTALKAKAQTEGESVYLFEKKSREKE